VAEFTRITSHLWVGRHPTRDEAVEIAHAGATHAIDLRGEPSANGPSEHAEPDLWAGTGVRYTYVPMRDDGSPIPAQKYADATSAVAAAIDAGGTVFLYCKAGHSRSPSVAYAYLRRQGMSASQAWSAVARRRSADRQYVPSADRYLAGIGIGPDDVGRPVHGTGTTVISTLYGLLDGPHAALKKAVALLAGGTLVVGGIALVASKVGSRPQPMDTED
jgi:protein tyrosine phosphatase (PTP) superfamily phosphohydrolase (DUF442 family)